MAETDSTASATEAGQESAPSVSEIARQQASEMAGQSQAAADTPAASERETTVTPDEGGTFYDSTTVPPELAETYKQMQKAYTKKTQSLAAERDKVRAYDAFMANPEASLRQLASQYGYAVNPSGQIAQPAENQQDWEPSSWDEVISRAEERAEQRVLERLAPFLGELRDVKKTAIEQQLDSAVPDWRQWEDEFKDAIQAHPTLVQDPVKLARIAMPEDVLESKATQRALAKLRTQQESAQVGGGSETSRTPARDEGPPRGAKSFSEAVQMAADHLRSQGRLYRTRS